MSKAIQRNTGRLEFASVAVMRTFNGGNGLADGETVYLHDSDNPGTFEWSTSSTAADDGVDVVKITGWVGAGRFLRLQPNAANSQYNQGGTGAVDTTQEEYNQRVVSVKDFGAVGDGVTDDTAAFQLAANTAKPVYIPPGSYAITTVEMPNGSGFYGLSGSNGFKHANIIHSGSGQAFTTDEDESGGFSGILLKNFRITGGVTGQYAISSHLPYTFIDGIYIENSSGSYAGNGIRVYRGSSSHASMGGWSSTIKNCKVVTDENDAANPRTLCYVDINGGNVDVYDNEFLKGEVAINIVKGENINVRGNNCNRLKDQTSTAGSIVRASIIVGGTGSDVVKSCSIRDNYLEGHSRCILVNNAENTQIENNYVNDLGAYDPAFAAGSHGDIHITDLADIVRIENNNITIKYLQKSFVFADIGTNKGGWSSSSNLYYLDRQSSGTWLGNYFDGSDPVSRLNDNLTAYIASEVVTVNYRPTVQTSQEFDFAALADSTPTKIVDIASGEIWEVYVEQQDDTSRFTYALAHVTQSGSSAVSTIVSGTGVSITIASNEIRITQTTGSTRRMHVVARRLKNPV